jgi:large subunit ribosomal protein L5
MDITIVTTADNNAAGKALLDAFGFPFRRDEVERALPERKQRGGGPRGRRPGGKSKKK